MCHGKLRALVLDDGNLLPVRRREDVVEESGLTRPQKTSEDRDRHTLDLCVLIPVCLGLDLRHLSVREQWRWGTSIAIAAKWTIPTDVHAPILARTRSVLVAGDENGGEGGCAVVKCGREPLGRGM